MERKVEREKTIPAFAIDVSELEVLWGRLASLIAPSNAGARHPPHTSVEIHLPNEILRFDSVEELKEYAGLKGTVSKFSLYLHSGSRIIYFSMYSPSRPSTIHATGEDAAWCAGVVDVVYSFFQSHRAWYYRLASAPLMLIVFILSAAPFLLKLIFPGAGFIDATASSVGWLITLVALLSLSVFQSRVFPFGKLHMTKEESFIRRCSPELLLVLTALATVASLIGLFKG